VSASLDTFVVVDFAMEPPPRGTIAGYVTDDDSNPIAATVELTDLSGYSGTADAGTGYYEIPFVPAGMHTVKATLLGYLSEEHQDVAVEACAMCAQEICEMLGADLLLPLDDELDVHRKRARCVEPGAERGHVENDPRLVVDDSASIEAPVISARRLEGRRAPVALPARRLHVVVGVDQEGGSVGTGMEPLAHDVGMRVAESQHLHLLEATALEQIGDGIGTARDFCWIEARSGDARNARERYEIVDCCIHPAIEGLEDSVGGGHGANVASDRLRYDDAPCNPPIFA